MTLRFQDVDGRRTVRARLTTDHAASRDGQPVLVVDQGRVVDLASWLTLRYEVVIASEPELVGLRALGFVR